MNFAAEHNWWEWVFSGAGVTILITAGGWLCRKLFKPQALKHDPPSTSNASAAVTNNAQTNSLAIGVGASVNAPVAIGSNNTQSVTNIEQLHYYPLNAVAPILDRLPSSPTAREIIGSLKTVSAYQRERLAQDYVGLPVKWPARFYTMGRKQPTSHLPDPKPKDLWWVALNFGKEYKPHQLETIVCIIVDVNEHPRFKTIHQGTPIWVEGIIDQIGPDDWIKLKESSLSFE